MSRDYVSVPPLQVFILVLTRFAARSRERVTFMPLITSRMRFNRLFLPTISSSVSFNGQASMKSQPEIDSVILKEKRSFGRLVVSRKEFDSVQAELERLRDPSLKDELDQYRTKRIAMVKADQGVS